MLRKESVLKQSRLVDHPHFSPSDPLIISLLWTIYKKRCYFGASNNHLIGCIKCPTIALKLLDLCLEVLTVLGNELHLFWVTPFSNYFLSRT